VERPLLELREVTYQTGGQTGGKKILDGLDLAVSAGEVHALVGTNGTGKSTLARLIMGCEGYCPSRGEILFDGNSINGLRIHERARLGISMAWQEPARFEGISVGDYLTLGRRGADPSEYLRMVGLEPELYRRRMIDGTLSGGERKRMELASLLSLELRLAVLDEPDSGIDMLSTDDIINVITAFRGKGTSVLLITHRQEIVLIADRASQLCGGRIICQGDPGRVAEFYRSRKCLVCDGMECVYV
jgi:Fe-S cluster assembly ATP-binding protein